MSDSLKSRVRTSLCALAVELVILVKPIGNFINEHLFFGTGILTLSFKHLNSSKNCKDKCGVSCFEISLGTASSYYQLNPLNPKIKI